MRSPAGQNRVDDSADLLSSQGAEASGSGLSFADIALMLGRHKIFIAACTLVGLILAAVYAYTATPIYEAAASMRIDPERASSLGLSDLLTANGADDALQTEITILKSDTVAMATLNSLSDNEFQQYAGVAKNSIIMQPGATVLTRPQEGLVARVTSTLSAAQLGNTQLMRVSFRNPKPEVAAFMVNHAMEAYLRQNFDSRYNSVAQVAEWLSTQMNDLREHAAEAQRKLAQYQEQNNILGEDAANNTTIDRLRLLNSRLAEAQADRIVKEAQMRAAATGSPAVLATMINNPELSGLEGQQATLYNQYAQLSTKFGPNYPPLAELKKQMQGVDAEVQRLVQSAHDRLQQDYNAAVTAEQLLQSQYADQTEKAFALNRDQAEYAVLKSEGTSSRDLYDKLQYKLQQAGVDAGLNGVNTMIIDKARAPLMAIEPKKTLIMSFGLILGLFAGLSAAFVKEAVADNVQSAEQLERTLGYHMLAAVPKVSVSKTITAEPGSTAARLPMLMAYNSPLSRDAEAYRALRNAVLLSAINKPYKSVLITSALAGEGKSMTSSNYAVVLAQRGARVLVIDADLRRPRLHENFGLTNTAGLSNLILGEDIESPFKQPLPDLPNLTVLPAGRKVPLPSEALSSSKLRQMIEQWEQEYDVVIVDSAPILVVSDTLPLASYMDALILVTRYNQTPVRLLRRLRDVLTRAHANVAGVVMNQVSSAGTSYGGYGYGDYYN